MTHCPPERPVIDALTNDGGNLQSGDFDPPDVFAMRRIDEADAEKKKPS